jgi:hypothetical protein
MKLGTPRSSGHKRKRATDAKETERQGQQVRDQSPSKSRTRDSQASNLDNELSKAEPVANSEPCDSMCPLTALKTMDSEDSTSVGLVKESLLVDYDSPGEDDIHLSQSTDYVIKESDTKNNEMTGPDLPKEHTISNPPLPKTTQLDEPPDQTDTELKHHIYLVKSQTSGSDRVLIPLNPKQTLANALRGQTILEFPTFQLLMGVNLPPGFILEEDYLLNDEAAQNEMIQLLAEEGDLLSSKNLTSEDVNARTTTNNVLESLKKDIGS